MSAEKIQSNKCLVTCFAVVDPLRSVCPDWSVSVIYNRLSFGERPFLFGPDGSIGVDRDAPVGQTSCRSPALSRHVSYPNSCGSIAIGDKKAPDIVVSGNHEC